MANILAALGGAAGGIANALEAQREYGLKQQLLKQQILAAGGGPMAAPDPQDPNAPGGGSASATNGGGAVGASSPAAALMSGSPMATLLAGSAAASGPPAGAGNTTQGGTSASPDSAPAANSAPAAGNATQSGVASVPTDQATVINQARQAATGPSPSSTGAPSGMAGILNGAASKVGASATPVGADPIGGLNSGLMASGMMTPGKMIKVGKIDGQDWGQPQVMPAQVAAARQALLNAQFQSGLQGQSQQFQGGLEKQRETFEGGQQSALLSAEGTRQQAQITSAEKIAAQSAAIRHEELQKQTEQMEIMFGLRKTKQTNDAMTDITKPLLPIEKQATSIAHAQDMLNTAAVGGDPAAVKSALTDAFIAMGPGGQARLTPQLVEVSGQAGGGSIPDRVARTVQMITSGQYPAKQMANLQQGLGSELANLQQTYHGIAKAGVMNHPEIDPVDGLQRMQIREGAYFPQGSAGASSLVQQAAAAIASGKDPKAVAARLKQLQGAPQ